MNELLSMLHTESIKL